MNKKKDKLEKEIINKMPLRFRYFLNKAKELKIDKLRKAIK